MFQYPKQRSVTLPSVEGGFGTLKILKDPPKGVYTRFKSKVGDTSKITEWIDSPETGDRICESILPYSRGVNPMVSVSYRNNGGSNGGQVRDRSGTVGTDQAPLSSIGAGKLPYRIIRDGAFRPPIIAPEQLLPLSRQPRNTTSCTPNVGSNMTVVDKILKCPSDLKKFIKESTKICATPIPTLIMGKPTPDAWEVNQSIRDSLLKTMARTNHSTDYRLGILKNNEPKQPIQNKNYIAMSVNPVKIRECPGMSDKKGLIPMPLKNALTSSVNSGTSGYGETLRHTFKTERPCQRPRATASTNKQINGISRTIENRDVVLPGRPKAGSFLNMGGKSSYTYNPMTKPNAIAKSSIVNNALNLQNRR